MKRLVYRLLLLWDYVFHHNHDSKVLYYHDAGTKHTRQGTPTELMKIHFDAIRKFGFAIVKRITDDKNQVQICFDDGWKGLYDNKEFFIRESVFPTTFLIVSRLGTEGYMTREQVVELDKKGFCFGCHTWSHKYLTDFDDEGLKHEIIDAKAGLEKLLGHPVESICFPMGVFSDKVFNLCQEAGYTKIYSSIRDKYHSRLKKGLIGRNLIQAVSGFELKCILKGDSPLLRKKDIQREYKQS